MSRMQHVWHHATQDILVSLRQRRIKNLINFHEGTRNPENKTLMPPLKLFLPICTIELITMEKLGRLPRTTLGTQYVMVITDRYSKLTWAVPTLKTSAAHVASIFYDQWIVPNEISAVLLTDTSPKPLNKFFQTLFNFFGLKHLIKTEYQYQTSEQTEGYNGTLIAQMCHYVAEREQDCVILVQALTYTDNTQTSRSAGKTHFSFVLSRHWPGLSTLNCPSLPPTVAKHPNALEKLKARLFQRITVMREKNGTKLTAAQRGYKNHHDRCVHATGSLKPGKLVSVLGPLLAVKAFDWLGTDSYSKFQPWNQDRTLSSQP